MNTCSYPFSKDPNCILNNALDWSIPVMIMDRDKNILTINAAWEENYKLEREQVVGKSSMYFRSDLIAPSVYESLHRGLVTNGFWSGVLVNHHPELDEVMTMLTTIFKVIDNAGEEYYLAFQNSVLQINEGVSQSIGAMNTVEGVFLRTLARIAEWNDPDLLTHVQRVAKRTEKLARWAVSIGLFEAENVESLAAGSLTHDIGKAGIAVEVLQKPAKLTSAEFRYVQEHTNIGKDMLSVAKEQLRIFFPTYTRIFTYALEIVESHHERWDGNGYPNKLAGDDIPISGRIVAIADVVDALFSKRSYKDKWASDDIKQYIQEQRGKQFDPRLVDLVVKNWDDFILV